MAHQSASVKRIQREIKDIQKNPSYMYYAQPVNNSLFEWHFTIRGAQDSPFEKGVYHGRIDFPVDYPFKPPQIMFLNQSGRYQTNTPVCLSITSYHPEQWNSAWTIRTMLQAVISTFPDRGTEMIGIGGLSEFSDEQIQKIAIKSQSFECKTCNCLIIDQLSKELTDADKQQQSEESKQQQQELEISKQQEEIEEKELTEEQKLQRQNAQNQQLSELQKLKKLLQQGTKNNNKSNSNIQNQNQQQQKQEIQQQQQLQQQQQQKDNNFKQNSIFTDDIDSKIQNDENNITENKQEFRKESQNIMQNSQNQIQVFLEENIENSEENLSQNLKNLKQTLISYNLTENFIQKKIQWAAKIEELKEQGFQFIKKQNDIHQNNMNTVVEHQFQLQKIQKENSLNLNENLQDNLKDILQKNEQIVNLEQQLQEKNEEIKKYIANNYIELKQLQEGDEEEQLENQEILKQTQTDDERSQKLLDINKQYTTIYDNIKESITKNEQKIQQFQKKYQNYQQENSQQQYNEEIQSESSDIDEINQFKKLQEISKKNQQAIQKDHEMIQENQQLQKKKKEEEEQKKVEKKKKQQNRELFLINLLIIILLCILGYTVYQVVEIPENLSNFTQYFTKKAKK